MKPNIILITMFATVMAWSFSEAKIVRRELGILTTPPATKEIAKGYLEFVYDYKFNADTVHDMPVSDRMLLQISPEGVSRFSCLRNLMIDSIIPTMSKDELVKNAAKLTYGNTANTYKNYLQGKVTHIERIALDWFKYEEDMPQFDWIIGDSVRMVLDYECREAECSFRGRKWTVFFTEEIPVMDGPWKLCGLPGLIMSASDENGQYQFECTGIRTNAAHPLTICDEKYNLTERKKFYDILHRYETNPYGYAETVCGIHVTVTDEAGNPDATAYDPLELGYDFIERDWREK